MIWVDPADDYDEFEEKYLKARALLFSLKRSQEPTTPTTTTRHAVGDSIANNDAISRLVQQQQKFFERLGATSTAEQLTPRHQ